MSTWWWVLIIVVVLVLGVWRDPASPLTMRRQQPDHGRRSWWTRPTAWRRGRWV
jgi:hypothetical protein